MQAQFVIGTTRLAVALLLCFGLASANAATPFQSAQKLWLAGQRAQAVSVLKQALKDAPEQLQLRFQLGVYEMEMGQTLPAEALFTQLTQDYPDLADPYNNLAVISAARGDLDAAHTALEQALRLQPDHAQAQENMGDVLLRMALRAYQRAAKVQPGPNEPLQLKLRGTQTLVDQLTPSSR